MNGILDENNPLNSNSGLDYSFVDQFYGEDPDSPHPQPLMRLLLLHLFKFLTA